jgi:predicted DCC family thiol-disulfide oxidoreductase YuxK
MSTLTIYYDGLCPLCSREMAHYRKRVTGDSVQFVDITEPNFDAAAAGVDPARVHRLMHVKLDGEMRVGLDAFIAIWDAVPGYRWLARTARLPGVYLLMSIVYHVFAWVRPWLSRRKRADCSSGTCSR